jgi:uncharacterized protein YjbJ (UPF0337 family)
LLLLTTRDGGQKTSMRIPRLDLQDLAGLFDKTVGLGKEIVGELLDDDGLIANGETQQRRGTQRLQSNRLTAKADARQASAQAFAAQERAAAERIAAEELAAAQR